MLIPKRSYMFSFFFINSMAQKCSLCKEKVDTTFLNKPIGTWIRDKKGKKQLVCNNCQKKFSATDLKEKL